jgi:Protein of unknown function (DUF3176)
MYLCCAEREVLIFLLDRRLVSLGAVITILVLAFDTFTQQVLTTEFKSVVVSKDTEAPLQLPRSEYISVSQRVFSGKSKYCYLILPPEIDTPAEVNICIKRIWARLGNHLSRIQRLLF